MKEFSYLNWVYDHPQKSQGCLVGPGDDAAIMQIPAESKLLFAQDTILDGVHFDSSQHEPERIGRKSVAVNLSDIAAMGGIPHALTVGLTIPKGMDEVFVKGLQTGIHNCAREYHVTVAGGDTCSWSGGLMLSIAMIGYIQNNPSLRSGAKAGDAILVTGELGGSILSKHLDFTPRVLESQWLHRHFAVTSMIDISDGLIADLGHIVTSSGVGAELWSHRIPVSNVVPATEPPLRLKRALHDGEDFELCFTIDQGNTSHLMETWCKNFPQTRLSHIGTVTDSKKIVFAGETEPIQVGGFEHDF